MTISKDLLSILVCPRTRRPLSMASDEQVAALNASIAGGSVKNVGDRKVERPMEAGLLTEDGEVIYPVLDGIPVLLIDEGIPTK